MSVDLNFPVLLLSVVTLQSLTHCGYNKFVPTMSVLLNQINPLLQLHESASMFPFDPFVESAFGSFAQFIAHFAVYWYYHS